MKQKLISSMMVSIFVLGLWLSQPASPVRAATKRWDGGGVTDDWTEAANWNDDTLPATGDDIILDNTNLADSYVVTIPAGTGTITLKSVTITPAVGVIIELWVKNGSGATPAMMIGDGVAANIDFTLNRGAILHNSAGTTSASAGIDWPSHANDRMIINDGARYIHNCDCTPRYISEALLKTPGTRYGIFEYDSPAGAHWNFVTDDGRYGTLVLSANAAGTFTYLTDPELPTFYKVAGDMIINPGVTLIPHPVLKQWTIRGNLINNSANFNFASSLLKGVYFGSWSDGSFGITANDLTTHSIAGSQPITFDAPLNVNTPATVTLARDITVNNNLTLTGTLNTGANVVGGTGSLLMLNGSTLGIGSPDGITASSPAGNIQTAVRSYNTTSNYTYNGSLAQLTGDGLPATVNNLAVNNTSGYVTLTQDVSANGTLSVPANARFDANSHNVTAAVLTNSGALKQTLPVTGSTGVAFFNTGGYGGLTINANGNGDLGSTVVVIRGSQACDTNNTSVRRCFDITPANTASVNATLTFAYSTAELNSEDCTSMNAYHYTGTAWAVAGSPTSRTCVPPLHTITAAGVTAFSPFALSSGGLSPTTVTLNKLAARSGISSQSAGLAPAAVLLLLAGGFVLLRKRFISHR